MDRIIVTPGQIPLDTDLLNTNKNIMLALGNAFQAIFGTSTIANGLAVTPAATGLTVNVAPGSIYSLQNVDNTAYGSLPANTTATIVKQGILASIASLSCPAPTTAGYSVNYLIEATYADVDGVPVLLPFYNASNPAEPWEGPGNNQEQTNTLRQGQCGLFAKPGVQATTGSQVTPSLDPGYIALAVVTVAYGQTSISAGNIVASTQSTLGPSILQGIQSNVFCSGTDTGAVNACVVNLSPAPSALTNNMVVEFQVADANTGATTLNLNGSGVYPVIGAAHLALQGGELIAGGKAEVIWSSSLASWILIGCTGGAQQVGAATQSHQAMQLGQATGRWLNTQVFTSSGSYTPTAGTTHVHIRAAAGGGGGGGCATTTASTVAAATGGTSGGYCELWAPSIGAQTITIGAGGTAGPAGGGSSGGIGGNTSIGSLITLIGGNGGKASGAGTPPFVITPPNATTGNTISVSGQILVANLSGVQGAPGIGMSTSATNSVNGGGGGSTVLGLGQALGLGAGVAGTGYGWGGGGAALVPSSTQVAGAAGGGGIVIIEEYA